MKLFSFTKEQRIKKPSDFSSVFSCQRKRKFSGFTCYINQKNKTDFSDGIQNKLCRLGVVVSKKTAKRAVDRNRIKRVVKECFRLTITKQLTFNDAIDCVIVVYPYALTLNQSCLQQNIQQCFSQLCEQFSFS